MRRRIPATSRRWYSAPLWEAAMTARSSSENPQRSAWPRSTSASSWNGFAEERNDVGRSALHPARRRPPASTAAIARRWRDSRIAPRHTRTSMSSVMEDIRAQGPEKRSADDDEATLEEEASRLDPIHVDPRAHRFAFPVGQVPALEVAHRIVVLELGHQVARHGVDRDLGLHRQLHEVDLVGPGTVPYLARAEWIRNHRDDVEIRGRPRGGLHRHRSEVERLVVEIGTAVAVDERAVDRVGKEQVEMLVRRGV